MIFATLLHRVEWHGTFLVVGWYSDFSMWMRHSCCLGFCIANHTLDYFGSSSKYRHSFVLYENLAEIAKNPLVLKFLNYLCRMHLLHMCTDDDVTMLLGSFVHLVIRLYLRMTNSNLRFLMMYFYLWKVFIFPQTELVTRTTPNSFRVFFFF